MPVGKRGATLEANKHRGACKGAKDGLKDGTVRYSCWEMDCSGSKEERAKARSKTFPGIAKAMAEQWG